MRCININLNIDLFTFNIYYICKSMYMTVIHYQNKTLCNKLFFDTTCTDLLFSYIQRTHPKINNINKILLYDTNIMQFTILRFSRLLDTTLLYALNIFDR